MPIGLPAKELEKMILADLQQGISEENLAKLIADVITKNNAKLEQDLDAKHKAFLNKILPK